MKQNYNKSQSCFIFVIIHRNYDYMYILLVYLNGYVNKISLSGRDCWRGTAGMTTTILLCRLEGDSSNASHSQNDWRLVYVERASLECHPEPQGEGSQWISNCLTIKGNQSCHARVFLSGMTVLNTGRKVYCLC